jgi:hypothetical protein
VLKDKGSNGRMTSFFEQAGTTSTPYILFDENKGYLRIEGRSFHKNAVEFYKEIFDYLDTFLETDFGNFTFDCELNYFNSSTAKVLLNLLKRMEKSVSEKNNITVNWITTESNDIVIECGEDYIEELRALKFNMIIN